MQIYLTSFINLGLGVASTYDLPFSPNLMLSVFSSDRHFNTITVYFNFIQKKTFGNHSEVPSALQLEL